MAVRVRIRIRVADRELEAVALLNGGFEMADPHLVLPAACAAHLVTDYHNETAHRELSTVAGGRVDFLDLIERGDICAVATDRTGPHAMFRLLVSPDEEEVIISDLGIDALGIQIVSFSGRWRFAGETLMRDTEAPQYWSAT